MNLYLIRGIRQEGKGSSRVGKRLGESLLTSRIEEEFLTRINCCSCGIANAEFRCLECGQDQYLCQRCANSTHETINYFHVLEKFKVRKFDLILSTSVFIFYVQLRAVFLNTMLYTI